MRARAGGAVPHDVEERILRKADGNPFYLEELTRALVEDGTLVARDGQVVATRRSDEIRIPDTIGEVLGARIDRLRPAAKRVAQVASVLGRQFRARARRGAARGRADRRARWSCASSSGAASCTAAAAWPSTSSASARA